MPLLLLFGLKSQTSAAICPSSHPTKKKTMSTLKEQKTCADFND